MSPANNPTSSANVRPFASLIVSAGHTPQAQEAVLVATSNEPSALHDLRGALHISVTRPTNIAWVAQNRDQLFAEAVTRCFTPYTRARA